MWSLKRNQRSRASWVKYRWRQKAQKCILQPRLQDFTLHGNPPTIRSEPMNEHQITIAGDSVVVYESSGEGHPVLFVHGNSSSGLTFSNLLDGDLGKSHRVLAIDLPGHGQSHRPNDPNSTYSLPGYARVVAHVVEKLDLRNVVLIGWSLGGHVIMEAANFLSAAGFVIYGAPPLGKPPAMDRALGVHPGMGAMFEANPETELVQSLIKAYFSHESSASVDELFAMWRQTDGTARVRLGQTFGAGEYTDELQIVQDLKSPIAILQGAHDELVRREYLESIEIPCLWRGAVQVVPGAAHALHLENPEVFSRLVAEFLGEVTA